MAERVRNRIDKGRLVRTYEARKHDYLAIDDLGIDSSTERGIIDRYLRQNRVDERPPGGRNHVKVDEEMRRYLDEVFNENCMLTFTAINAELQPTTSTRKAICQ